MKLPRQILREYPIGTRHQTRPTLGLKTASALPFVYAPPTQVAEKDMHGF